MSPVREKFIKIIEALPYELEEEIKTRDTFSIMKEITENYVAAYGTDDLSEDDKEVISNVLGNNFNNFKD